MPTLFDDGLRVEKKICINNDPVLVVWCENDKEYKAETIVGSANLVHIIVYPLRNRLCRIRAEKKKMVKFFGPLLKGMVLPINILSVLLRYTILNAKRCITLKGHHPHNLLKERKSRLKNIILDHSIKQEPKAYPADQFIRLAMIE